MHEEVNRSVLGGDEAETLLGVEPLHDAPHLVPVRGGVVGEQRRAHCKIGGGEDIGGSGGG